MTHQHVRHPIARQVARWTQWHPCLRRATRPDILRYMADGSEVFLRGVWHAMIPRTDDLGWVDRVALLPASDQPLGDLGPVVRRMLDAGLDARDIARFAQIVGYETAVGLCCHLDDPNASYEGFDDDDGQLEWGLFLIDPSGTPGRRLTGLHESILSMDPSGREMRP